MSSTGHLVHEPEVEERGEDGAEAGDGGGPDQVEDGVEAGEGDGQQQDRPRQAAAEGHPMPAEGWKVVSSICLGRFENLNLYLWVGGGGPQRTGWGR